MKPKFIKWPYRIIALIFSGILIFIMFKDTNVSFKSTNVAEPEPVSEYRFETLETFPFLEEDSTGWPGNIIRDKVTGECYLYSRYRMANAPCPEKKETKLAKSVDK